MITLELQRLCNLRGIAKPYAFLRAAGFSHNLSHNLANGVVKSITFAHLEKLCRIFNCMPQELFTYKPAGRGVNPATDILLPLRKKPLPTKGLNSLLATLPPDDLLNLTDELQARFNKETDQPASEPTNGL